MQPGPTRRTPAFVGFVAAALAMVSGAAMLSGALAQPAAKPAQPAATQSAPRPAQIDRNGVLILVRSTILALDHANRTGNYTVLRDLAAPGFQVNTAARLAEIFADQRRDKLDLSGVAVIEPQLSLLPQIEQNGMMRLAGFFPSIPKQVNFEMIFAAVDGQWRLFGLSVALGQTSPAAPQAAPAAPPAPAASPAPRPAPAAPMR
ncbi:MAG: hypothetical protein HXX10_12140 [Rhodoplanes sp.]|uniref:hypothetical protein n=1 Tax=Rhodoplanes sp. TaxID=1968906 RepID=UPI0017B3D934|nr:hypothetical protein [Rhodoplanes sp.]NVO14778.1 hypothetical protein [Rhodoplanes sp.]